MNVSWEFVLTAVLPALALAGYVLLSDRVEKEPWWLLAALFGFGAVAYVPAHFLRDWLTEGMDWLLSDFITYDLQGNPAYASPWTGLLHRWLLPVITAALLPELLKWLAMFLPTFRSRQFNCLFDGVVYGVFVALGYGVAENLWYAWQGGWDMLLRHSLSTLPCHLYCGVVAGWGYTLWRLYRTLVRGEKHYAAKGLITVTKPFRSGLWFAGMLLLPVLLHSVTVLVGISPAGGMREVYYLCNGVLFVLCMAVIHRLSRTDQSRGRYADALLDGKYPGIRDLYEDLEAQLPKDEEADHG